MRTGTLVLLVLSLSSHLGAPTLLACAARPTVHEGKTRAEWIALLKSPTTRSASMPRARWAGTLGRTPLQRSSPCSLTNKQVRDLWLPLRWACVAMPRQR